MYLSPGVRLAMKSRLSSTCCAVTRGPKQYQEHQPVGGLDDPVSRGWWVARRSPTAASSLARSEPADTISSSSGHVPPASSDSPSQSSTARSEEPCTMNLPLNRAHDVNARTE